MSTFSALNGAQFIKALRRLGFDPICIKGSHHFLRHPDGRCTVIPVHRSETIGRGLAAQILRDCEITREDIQKEI